MIRKKFSYSKDFKINFRGFFSFNFKFLIILLLFFSFVSLAYSDELSLENFKELSLEEQINYIDEELKKPNPDNVLLTKFIEESPEVMKGKNGDINLDIAKHFFSNNPNYLNDNRFRDYAQLALKQASGSSSFKINGNIKSIDMDNFLIATEKTSLSGYDNIKGKSVRINEDGTITIGDDGFNNEVNILGDVAVNKDGSFFVSEGIVDNLEGQNIIFQIDNDNKINIRDGLITGGTEEISSVYGSFSVDSSFTGSITCVKKEECIIKLIDLDGNFLGKFRTKSNEDITLNFYNDDYLFNDDSLGDTNQISVFRYEDSLTYSVKGKELDFSRIDFDEDLMFSDFSEMNRNYYRLGDKGKGVEELSRYLKNRGYYSGEITDTYSNDLRRSVERYQKYIYTKSDGSIGSFSISSSWLNYELKGTKSDDNLFNSALIIENAGDKDKEFQYFINDINLYRFNTNSNNVVNQDLLTNEGGIYKTKAGEKTIESYMVLEFYDDANNFNLEDMKTFKNINREQVSVSSLTEEDGSIESNMRKLFSNNLDSDVEDAIKEFFASKGVDIDSALFLSIIYKESSGDSEAKSNKGARGLTQVVYESAGKDVNNKARNKLIEMLHEKGYTQYNKDNLPEKKDLYDPKINMIYGYIYYNEVIPGYIRNYNNQGINIPDTPRTRLAMYHQGPSGFRNTYRNNNNNLEDALNNLPTYGRDYVQTITSRYEKLTGKKLS
jgi:hypothetical protein